MFLREKIVSMTQPATNQSKAIKLDDMKIGESFVGYLKKYFKNPKSQYDKETENPVFVTPTGEEVVIWAKGSLKYLRERATDKGLADGGVGVLTKLTRIEKPAGNKSRQQIFLDIKFKPSDVKSVEELGVTSERSSDPTTDEF